MKENTTRIHAFGSLRVQLLAGAALLLAITVASVGYLLSVNQRRSLTQTMIQTVVLQGRNVALSGEKSILRPDPEFELCPLVTRVTADVPDIRSLVVVDRNDAIQGHSDPSRVGANFDAADDGAGPVQTASLRDEETLRETDDAYYFETPIASGGTVMGTVYLEYSKRALNEERRRALVLTIELSTAALLIGLLLALAYFSRISRPMGVLMKGLDALGRDLSFSIHMPAQNEFRVLAGAFNKMARQIQEAQRQLLAKERLAHEIELARQIQESLIPRPLAQSTRFEIGYHYESAFEVGGDYVDIIHIDRSHLLFIMADVSGKGVPGMVIMAMTRALLHEFASSASSPRDILIRLNDALAGNIRRGMFVTAFVGVLDVESGELVCSNAGHNPMVLYQSHSREAAGMHLQGVPLGLFRGDQFASTVENSRMKLVAGDLAMLYTDGLVESANANAEQFTLQRVIDLANRHSPSGAKQVVQLLVNEEKRFRGDAEQKDDITLLAFGVPAARMSAVEA